MNEDAILEDVRRWLAENWNAESRQPSCKSTNTDKSWLQRVFDAGWAVASWPEQWWGRGLSNAVAAKIDQEFAKVGANGSGQDRRNIAANTIFTFGSDALKLEYLPQVLTGNASSCLLYSEPGAGSDLAAVRTRADRVGGGWRVTGQKVWTSGAQDADFAFLLARTDWDRTKHTGISFFLLPMKQAGIDVRPIHQITGDSHFNEVFIDGAHVPGGNLLGEENGGWKVLQTALAYERLIMGEGAGERRQGSKQDNRIDLIELAREKRRLADPLIRQQIAQAIAWRRLNDLNMARAKAEMAQGSSSPIMSLGKLAMSRILHNEARVMTEILGAESMLTGESNPLAADVNYRAFNAYMTSIGGGTDQVQRNIIGERVLGLPREIEVDRDLPFRQSRAVKG